MYICIHSIYKYIYIQITYVDLSIYRIYVAPVWNMCVYIPGIIYILSGIVYINIHIYLVQHK